MDDLNRYLWEGLNLERYSVVKILPQDEENAVIIMRSKDPTDDHWSLEYRGSGHYFSTAEELITYYHDRGFKPKSLTFEK